MVRFLSFLVGTLLLAPGIVSAQNTETELLRAAVQRAELTRPLLEANVEERLGVERRLGELQKDWDNLDLAFRGALAGQKQARDALQELPVEGGFGTTEEVKSRKEERDQAERKLKVFTYQMERGQVRQGEVGWHISEQKARLAVLEDEYAEMRQQMLAMAEARACPTTDVAE